MLQLSQGCIALPGGFGTLEEIFEALCWSQRPVELHEKPCVFANAGGYYDHLFEFLDHAEAQGLLLPENRALARLAPSAGAALQTTSGGVGGSGAGHARRAETRTPSDCRPSPVGPHLLAATRSRGRPLPSARDSRIGSGVSVPSAHPDPPSAMFPGPRSTRTPRPRCRRPRSARPATARAFAERLRGRPGAVTRARRLRLGAFLLSACSLSVPSGVTRE